MLPTLLTKHKVYTAKGDPVESDLTSVDYMVKELTRSKEKHKYSDLIYLLKSETGTGKSTVLPPKLFLQVQDKSRYMVVTQPRRFNTITIPYSIEKFNKEFKVGYNIGYSTSVEKQKIKSGLMYVTIDTLLEQLKSMSNEKFLNLYSYIIVDEVHVRNVGLDILFFKLKKLLERYYDHPECPKIIFMSATFDVNKFAKYFEVKDQNIFWIKGASFNIEKTFLKIPTEDLVAASVEKAAQLHKNKDSDKLRDILIFIDGMSTAKKVEEGISKIKNLFPIIFTSDTASKAKKYIDYLPPGYTRKCFIGTNAIETGVTIESLKYVIETGWAMNSEYYPNSKLNALTPKPVTQNASKQRIGRVGRVADGFAYFMYTELVFKSLMEDAFPDIITSDISELMLYEIVDKYKLELFTYPEIWDHFDNEIELIKIRKNSKSSVVDMLDKPPGESAISSIHTLHLLGYIDKERNLTKLGFLMNKLNMLSIESRKMVFSGFAWNINIEDLLIIGCMLNFKVPRDFNARSCISEEWGEKIPIMLNDNFIELLLVYRIFQIKLTSLENADEWCKKHLLSLDAMIAAVDNVSSLKKKLRLLMINIEGNNILFNINQYLTSENTDEFFEYLVKLKMCIFEGYKGNIAIETDYGKFKAYRSNFSNTIIQNEVTYPIVMYNSLGYSYVKGKYKVLMDKVSVISGYFNPDLNMYRK